MSKEKFCNYHGESIESVKEGVLDCHAHLAEGRVFVCRYNSGQEALNRCVDFDLQLRQN